MSSRRSSTRFRFRSRSLPYMSTAWSSVSRHAWCRKHTSARWQRRAAISRTRSADAAPVSRTNGCRSTPTVATASHRHWFSGAGPSENRYNWRVRNTRRGRHSVVLQESRRRSRNNRMNRRQARSLPQRFDRLEECIRENARRDFIRQLTMSSVSVVASFAGAHWLSQQSQDTGNQDTGNQLKGQEVRGRVGSIHAVRGAGNIDVRVTASVLATGIVSAEVVTAAPPLRVSGASG